MKRSVMSYIPQNKRDGIHDAWEDSDGMWIMLKAGWVADRSCAPRTIHEDYVKDLRYQIAGIRKLKDTERKFFKDDVAMLLNEFGENHFTVRIVEDGVQDEDGSWWYEVTPVGWTPIGVVNREVPQKALIVI